MLIFSCKKDSPKRRKPPKPRYVVSKAGPQVANEELEVNSTILNVDKVADEKLEVNTCNTSLNVDEVYEVLEVDFTFQVCKPSQEESVSELKRQVVELINKLDEQKEKTNALEAELNEVKQQLVNLTSRYNELEKKSFSLDRFRNCKSLGFYTGFASDEIIDALYNFCDPGENGENDEYMETFPKPGRLSSLHPKEELFITFCRLRQGFAEEHLAHLYGISQATISRIIITWVNLLYLRLKDVPMWPSREKVNKHMPGQFKEKYPSTRIIIDCT